jgi:cell division protease FtsH
MNNADRRSLLPYILVAGSALTIVASFLMAPHPESISYSEFKTLLRKGRVADLVVNSHAITGTVASEGLEGLLPAETIEALKRSRAGAHRFVTARVEDPGLVSELEAANVKFTGRVENPWLSTVLSWAPG